jgi:drug/metabolite transporter (DMT)-like permease
VSADLFASLSGELIILFATACWAVGIILMKQVPRISPFLAIRNIFALAALPTVPLALVIERPWLHPVSMDSVVALLVLGIVCGGIAYGLFLFMIMRAGPTFSSLVGYLVTLFGVLFGIAFMGDPFGGNDVVAVGLIALGLAAARREA